MSGSLSNLPGLGLVSGALGGVTGLASQASSLVPGISSTLAQIPGMVPITLGNMPLLGFAVPERVSHGFKQQLTVHKLPGGARVIDVMGLDEPPITWSGILLGLGAQAQRQQLFAMVEAGKPVELWWGDQYRVVIVESVDCDSKEGALLPDVGPAEIRYRVSCVILPPTPNDGDSDGEIIWSRDDPTPWTTPDEAKDAGQGAATSARAVAPRIPVPPIPPSTIPARGGGAAP